MGKFFAGLLRFVFGLAVLAALTYQTWQIRTLRADVDALKQRAAPAAAAAPSRAAAGGAERPARAAPGDALAEARRHAEQAEALLRRQQYGGAMRELADAAEAARRAGDDARKQSQAAVADLRRTIATLKNQAETALADGGGHGAAPAARRGDDQ